MAAAKFPGFSPDLFAFLKGLKARNEKAWFDAHREDYERNVKQPLGDLVEELAASFAKSGLPLRGDRKASLFRLHRDVRFSKDKSPYKTAATAMMTRSGTKHEPGMLYLHFEPGASFFAAGFYMPEPPVLLALRTAIATDLKAFLKVVAALRKSGLEIEREYALARPPRAFTHVTDTVALDWLRLTSVVVSRKLKDSEVLSADLAAKAKKFAKEILPLLQFGEAALPS